MMCLETPPCRLSTLVTMSVKVIVVFSLLSLTFAGVIDNSVDNNDGVHWALLVAGSNGWYNYRHQADTCHAYQIMHDNGIPDERIVVMMYDDLANNPENPTPGIVINHPNGSDVYHDVPHDYTGEDVTPENFLKILQGDSEGMAGIGSGKVIKSGPNDNVFVNFADHGAPGIVAFPSGELTATDLNKAIQDMYNKQQYNKMVFYIEACESGSMFSGLLPKNINVFATTAANPDESSYACYYDDLRDTYLGDVYSVMWMEDSDVEDLTTETLEKQYDIVKQETNTSHVMEYGDLTMGSLTVIQFQGDNPSKIKKTLKQRRPRTPTDSVPAPDVKLAILRKRLEKTTSDIERRHIHELIKEELHVREAISETMKKIVGYSTDDPVQAERVLNGRRTLYSRDCYEPVMHHFSRNCYAFHKYEHALRHLYKLVNLCEEPVPTFTILEAIDKACLL